MVKGRQFEAGMGILWPRLEKQMRTCLFMHFVNTTFLSWMHFEGQWWVPICCIWPQFIKHFNVWMTARFPIQWHCMCSHLLSCLICSLRARNCWNMALMMLLLKWVSPNSSQISSGWECFITFTIRYVVWFLFSLSKCSDSPRCHGSFYSWWCWGWWWLWWLRSWLPIPWKEWLRLHMQLGMCWNVCLWLASQFCSSVCTDLGAFPKFLMIIVI